MDASDFEVIPAEKKKTKEESDFEILSGPAISAAAEAKAPSPERAPLSPDLKGPQNSPRMGQALLRGALTTPRLIEDLATRQGRFGKTTPGTLDKLVPEVENPTTGEQLAGHLGSFVDPAALATGAALGKGFSAAYEAFSPLERRAASAAADFAAEQTAKTSSALYRATVLNNSAKAGLEGFGFGSGMTGVSEVSGGSSDIKDVAEKMLLGGGVGATLGAFGGAALSGAKGKPKFSNLEAVSQAETPAVKALNDELASALAEHSRAKDSETSIIEAARGKIAQTQSSTIDEAAQKAAFAEENHRAEIQQLSATQSETTDTKLKEYVENLKTESFVKKEQRLADLSSNMNARLETLDSQRKNILGTIGEADQATLEKTRAKLQDLNGRIAQLQDARDSFAISSSKPTEGSTYDRNAFIKEGKDVALQQVQKVDAAVKKGLLDPEYAPALKAAEWENAHSLLGLDTEKKNVWNLGEILGKQVDFANMDEKLGVKAGEKWNQILFGRSASKNYAQEFESKASALADGLNKLGLDDKQITHALQYVESSGFNPEAVSSQKLSRPAWSGPLPSQEQMQGLSQMRQLFSEARQQAVSKGLSVGHIEGYVPLISKSLPDGSFSSNAASQLNPRFMQARQAGYLDPETMETNIRQLAKRYGSQVGKASYLKEPFEQSISEMLKLRMQGNYKEAERFETSVFRAMGISDKKTAGEILGKNLVDANFSTIEKLAAMSDNSQGFIQEVLKESNNLMYGSVVTSNPSTILKQFLQPEVLGPAELGHANVETSRLIALGPKSALKTRAEGLLKYVLQDEVTAMTEQGLQAPKTLLGKGMRLAGIPLKPTTKIYGATERLNRMTALIGGIRKFESAVASGSIDSALEGLASFEKGRIQEVLKKQGPESAANLYGMLKNNRINFTYDAINKPELLQSKLGALVPFTGFARGIADGLATNVISGNYKQLAKMVAYPLALGYVASALSGKDMQGVNPTDAALGLLTPKIAPQITEPAKKYVQTKSLVAAGKEALRFTPYGAAERILKAKTAGEVFGIKDKEQVSGYIKQLSRDLGKSK